MKIKYLFNKILKLIKNKKIADEENLHKYKIDFVTNRLYLEKHKLLKLIPLSFRVQFEDSSYISGGCIYSLYNNQTPKDYDFFLTDSQLANEIKEYFIEQSGYRGTNICGGQYKGHPLIVTDNAISIGNYQIILQWVGTPEEVVSQFDFAHNQFYFHNKEIQTLSDFECLKSKELKYNDKRARDICGTIIRTSKFIKRGMSITNKEMAKMLLKLHEVGFNERELAILKDNTSSKSFGS